MLLYLARCFECFIFILKISQYFYVFYFLVFNIISHYYLTNVYMIRLGHYIQYKIQVLLFWCVFLFLPFVLVFVFVFAGVVV